MNVCSFGCSFTFGTELFDDGRDLVVPTPSQFTWPALIAKKLGVTYHCQARGGSGNLSIMDRVGRYRSYNPQDFLIINWSFQDRFDYSDPDGMHFDRGSNDYLTARPGELDPVSGFYYRHLHSEYRDKLTNLLYIKSTIDMLTHHGTKFMMTAIDDVMWCQKWHVSPLVLELQEFVRPYIASFEHRNFLDWAQHRGFQITAAGHPLEDAHAAAAELMWDKVTHLLEN
jgi:hypothetical protein